MPASKATLRNAQQKANREAGIGDASGRLPARVKDEKPKLSCEICKVLLECTKSNTELKKHALNKHGKANYEECFPGAEKVAAELLAKVSKGGSASDSGKASQGPTKAQKKKQQADGLDDLMSAGLNATGVKKKGK